MKFFYFLIILLICNTCITKEYPKYNQINIEGYEATVDTINGHIVGSGIRIYSGGEMHGYVIIEKEDSTWIDIDNYMMPQYGKFECNSLKDTLWERDSIGWFVCRDFIFVAILNEDNENRLNMLTVVRSKKR
jgi:hypothetical protein